jgi:large subunit ribosomal protein L15
MQLHQIKAKTKRTRHVQVGRGGKRGKTSGRGTKGQNARAGRKKRPELRDIIKKIPKQRGRGKNIFQSFQVKPAIVNLEALEATVAAGETVTPAYLVEKGLVNKTGGRVPSVKILGTGDLSKKFNVTGCTVSATAKSKIEKVGGKIE